MLVHEVSMRKRMIERVRSDADRGRSIIRFRVREHVGVFFAFLGYGRGGGYFARARIRVIVAARRVVS